MNKKTNSYWKHSTSLTVCTKFSFFLIDYGKSKSPFQLRHQHRQKQNCVWTESSDLNICDMLGQLFWCAFAHGMISFGVSRCVQILRFCSKWIAARFFQKQETNSSSCLHLFIFHYVKFYVHYLFSEWLSLINNSKTSPTVWMAKSLQLEVKWSYIAVP